MLTTHSTTQVSGQLSRPSTVNSKTLLSFVNNSLLASTANPSNHKAA